MSTRRKWDLPVVRTWSTDCFAVFTKAIGSHVSPWLEAELEDTEAVMGTDFHPYGFEKNRRTIEVFADQALAIGVVNRRISPEEYFADFLAS